MLGGIFWILAQGAQWRDFPERYGPWKTVYRRFCKWCNDEELDHVLERLHLHLRQDGLIGLDTWMIDSTTRAARSASGEGGGRGLIEPYNHAGLTTKIYPPHDCQAHCYRLASMRFALLQNFAGTIPAAGHGISGRPCKKSCYIIAIADKGYDSDDLQLLLHTVRHAVSSGLFTNSTVLTIVSVM